MSVNKFEKMRIAVRYWLQGSRYYLALKAMNLGEAYHTGLRKDGITPEFHHQVSIISYIRTLSDLMFPEDTLAAGLLHDVVEDYDADIEVISKEFNSKIASAVRALTNKDKDLEEYYKEIMMCPIASIVKGADRIHNIQTMEGVFSDDKKEKYIAECEDYILPMLKEARRRFPEQEAAYENIKLVMLNQIELVKVSLKK